MTQLHRRHLLAGAGVVAGLVTGAPEQAVAAQRPGSRRTLTFRGRFTGAGDPDWHYLPFRVPRGVRAIEVAYQYEATDTGAGFSTNVVDIGLFDPDGFRGWSGGARKGFRVTAAHATPGYLAGPIHRGTWRVALGPFLVLPPGVTWTVRVTLVFGSPIEPPHRDAPPPRRVSGTGAGWYRGDLHTHTVHSDGRHTQAGLAALAAEEGLDFIGSSEHNTSSATRTWGRVPTGDLLVVCGEEVTTRAGHWLAMGLPAGTWIDWRYRPDDDRLATVTRRVRALGGIAVACHPYVPIPGTKWDFGYDFAGMDAVEIWNGPWTLDDQTALVAWHTELTAGRFVPAVGSSDSHHPGQPVGRAQTVARLGTLSTGAVVGAVRRGNSWLAESAEVDLRFVARLGDRTASCGDHLDAAPTDLVPVDLRVAGAPGCLAQVIGPLGPLAGAVTDPTGRVHVTATVAAAAVPFVRAEVRRLDGAPVLDPLEGVPGLAMVAMTNPVWLRSP